MLTMHSLSKATAHALWQKHSLLYCDAILWLHQLSVTCHMMIMIYGDDDDDDETMTTMTMKMMICVQQPCSHARQSPRFRCIDSVAFQS